MKKVLCLTGFALLFLQMVSCKSGNEVTVTGKVNAPGDGQVVFTAWADTTRTELTAMWNAEERTYSISLKVNEPGYYRITFPGNYMADVLVNESDIRVDIDASGSPVISGSPEAELNDLIIAKQMAFQQSETLSALDASYQEAAARNDEAAMAELRNTYELEVNQVQDSIAVMLRKAMPSVGVIHMLNQQVLDRDKYFDFFQEVADGFKGKAAEYAMVKDFRSRVQKWSVTRIGASAPEISLPDPEGNTVKLSSFRGKFVLVDFWAKWCGPCRQENPNLVRAYNRFKDRNLAVLGVSLDRNKEDWVRAIAEDNLTWTHVSDLRYFSSQAALDYNIESIPFSVLIDPKGVIVAKNLRGSALEAALEKYLGGS